MDFKNKALFVGLLLCAAFVLLGCTSTSPVCGDNLCSAGEELTCPTDCAKTINGSIVVYVSGAYDSQGALSLEYYTSNNVNYNFNNTITSTLGSNWSGSTGRNLSISLNQSQSVVKQVPKYGDRQVVISNPKQGDYYFTARSDDYAYFGSSEKITIDEDKNYYVQLEVKPSQPAVRIKAVDNASNSQLSGPGNIEIHLVTDSYQNGESKRDDQIVNSLSFTDGQEINGLFYLWQPQQGIDYQQHFEAVVKKDGYSDATQYLWLDNKYNEFQVSMLKTSTQKGTLTVNLVPGTGTTAADLQRLVGTNLTLTGVGINKDIVIPSSLVVTVNDLPYGSYAVWKRIDSNINDPNALPSVAFDMYINLDSPIQQEKVTAFLGGLVKLSATNSASGAFLDPALVKVISLCTTYTDMNTGGAGCSTPNTSWANSFGTNPAYIPISVYTDGDLNLYKRTLWYLTASYKDQNVTSPMWSFNQGYNNWAITFPSDANLASCVHPVNSHVTYSPPITCTFTGDLGTRSGYMVKVDKDSNITIGGAIDGTEFQFWDGGGWGFYSIYDSLDNGWSLSFPTVHATPSQGFVIFANPQVPTNTIKLTLTPLTGVVNGVCGTANKTYSHGATSFGIDTFCAAGTSEPATPAFPTAGNSAHWSCVGANGGTSAICNALHSLDDSKDTNATLQPCVLPTSGNVTYSPPITCSFTGNLGKDATRMVKVDKHAQIAISNPSDGAILGIYNNGWNMNWNYYADLGGWDPALPDINVGEGFIIENDANQKSSLTLTP